MLRNPQIKSHGNNVFEAINAAVNSLEKTDSLNNLLIELGARHKSYGAKIEYFEVIKFKIRYVYTWTNSHDLDYDHY